MKLNELLPDDDSFERMADSLEAIYKQRLSAKPPKRPTLQEWHTEHFKSDLPVIDPRDWRGKSCRKDNGSLKAGFPIGR